MKYSQRFNSMSDANGFYILHTPFACTIKNGPNMYDTQNLHTNDDGKKIKVIDDVAYIENRRPPLYFKSNGQTTISLYNSGGNAPDMKYSLDGETWIQWDYSSISLNDGDIVYFKGNNPNGIGYNSSKYSIFKFSGTGTIEAHGDIMSLINDYTQQLLTIPSSLCFGRLFKSQTLLTSAPELPATTLTSGCYSYMFQDCTSLTSAPELPAETLVDNCYSYMFSGCANLNYIKCLATSGINTNSTYLWVQNVKSIGIFVKAPLASWPTSCMPSGWLFLVDEFTPTETFNPSGYITCSVQNNNSYIGLSKNNQTMYISKDAQHWMIMQAQHAIELNNNETVYICGNLTGNNTNSNYTQFAMIGKIAISGNCNALWNYNDLNAQLKQYCGHRLFYKCDITSAPELPATTLASSCYSNMFYGCTSLTSAPELPATTLASSCYSSMFNGCTSLTSAPELPAETMVDSCYASMFNGCTSLTSAPELPATTLNSYCYQYMFNGCTSLTSAPTILPATTLASRCYYSMFYGCTSLASAPELPATTLTSYCYYRMLRGCTNLNYIKCLATSGINTNNSTTTWVQDVKSTGTFIKSSSATWPSGDSGTPTGWTIQNA